MEKLIEKNKKFLIENIMPIKTQFTDEIIYRASAKLIDGTIIPCVRFKPNSGFNPRVESISRLLNENYKDMAFIRKLFVDKNLITFGIINEIIESQFVLPIKFRSELIEYSIKNAIDPISTSLPFITVMDDGKEILFSFVEGTEFLALLKNYNTKQIVKIIPQINSIVKPPFNNIIIFECYFPG